jgi:hypothetical protein
VLAELLNWHGSLGIKYERTEIASSLADALTSLLPLAASKMRRLFVATSSDWVASFQNGIQGSDPFPAMSYLAKRMGVLGMRVCCTPDRAEHPATIWEVHAPESLGGCPLGYRRSLSASNDGDRGEFYKSGKHYPFEQIERYAERRKRDRFTRDKLRDYLRHFGIELITDEFLRVDAATRAVRLQQVTNVWHTSSWQAFHGSDARSSSWHLGT